MTYPVARLQWLDNNGKPSQTSFRPGVEDDYTGARSIAIAVAEAAAPLSGSALLAIELSWTIDIAAPPPPGIDSNCRRRALLFYRNGTDCASLAVPSPPVLLAETSGLYAGVRITRERLALLALLASVEALPAGTLDPLGRPYGTAFTVGGIINL